MNNMMHTFYGLCLSGLFLTIYADNIDDAKALQNKQKQDFNTDLCNNKKSQGCVTLGAMYAEGKEIEKNSTKAFELFKKACDANNPIGCLDAGMFTHRGEGTIRNITKAVEYYKKACNLKQGTSCVILGDVYEKGEMVRQDSVIAKEFYGKACDNNMPYGCSQYAILNKRQQN